MARNLSAAMEAAVQQPVVFTALLFDLTFADNTYHMWSGIGNLVWGTTTYSGVGTLGKVSTITEGNGVEAQGVKLSLSGIDPTWLAESMNEINLATRAKIYLALLDNNGVIIANPVCMYTGIMDGPKIDLDSQTAVITIDVEDKMIELNRSRGGRLTSQDQRSRYPDDKGLDFVSLNQDKNLVWVP